MHIGILTGGGDCPGLNAVIRAVTLALIHEGAARVTGIERGFLGLLTRQVRPLPRERRGRHPGAGRHDPGHAQHAADPFHYFGAGGADVSAEALAYRARRWARRAGGHRRRRHDGDRRQVPRHWACRWSACPRRSTTTCATPTAASASTARWRWWPRRSTGCDTTGRSHGRVMIVETMGRYAGWIALEGGMAGAADVILLPETPVRRWTRWSSCCRAREARDGGNTLICIAEGASRSAAVSRWRARWPTAPTRSAWAASAQALRSSWSRS